MCGGNALMTEQGLDAHPFRPRNKQVRDVSMAQLVWADFLVDTDQSINVSGLSLKRSACFLMCFKFSLR